MKLSCLLSIIFNLEWCLAFFALHGVIIWEAPRSVLERPPRGSAQYVLRAMLANASLVLPARFFTTVVQNDVLTTLFLQCSVVGILS